jgi:hypothetical protein
MWIHLLILGVTLGFSAAYNVDMGGWYATMAGGMAETRVDVAVQALIVAFCLIVVAVVMAQMNAYALMLPLARAVLEVGLLGVSMISFGALYFSMVLVENLWRDLGIAAVAPYLVAAAAILALYIFDFNYPFRQKILGYLLLTAASLGLVFGLSL